MQFGQTLVFQFKQLLQIGYILFQCGNTLAGFLERLFAGNLILVATFSGSNTRLARPGFGLRDFQLVLRCGNRRGLVLHLGGDLARGLLLRIRFRNRRLGSNTGQLAAIGIPVGRLGGYLFFCFFRCNGLQHRLFGNGKNLAGLQAVHVAAIEGILIGTQQTNQHLIQRNAGRQVGSGNPAQCFALLDLMGLASCRITGRFLGNFYCGLFSNLGIRLFYRLFCRFFTRLRPQINEYSFGGIRRFRLHRRCLNGSGGRRCIGRSHPGLAHYGCRSLGRLGSDFRRVQQEGVLALQATGRPVEFEQHVDKGIVNRRTRRQLDDLLSAGTLVQREADPQQGRCVIKPGLLESFRRGQLGLHAGKLFARGVQLDLGPQGLPQRGENRDFSQTGSLRQLRNCGKSEARSDRQNRGSQFARFS